MRIFVKGLLVISILIVIQDTSFSQLLTKSANDVITLDDYRVINLPRKMNIINGTQVNFSSFFNQNEYFHTLDLGFSFSYMGKPFTKVKISPNGSITFDTLASGTGANYELRALFDALDDAGSARIKYLTTGSAPYRQFIIQYTNFLWNVSNWGHYVNFQIILNETTNDILFCYGDMFNWDGEESNGASIGITDGNKQFKGCGETQPVILAPKNNYLITCSKNTNDLGINDIKIVSANCNYYITLRKNDSLKISFDIYNQGLNSQTSIPLTYSITNGTFQFNRTETLNKTITPGQLQTVTLSLPWVPADTGIYLMKGYINLTGDLNHINDTLKQTIKVYDSNVILAEDFERYGEIIDYPIWPWIQYKKGYGGCGISHEWASSGNNSFYSISGGISSNQEIDYLKLCFDNKPAQLKFELIYSPSIEYSQRKFAEIGLAYVASKYDMKLVAGFAGVEHNLYFSANGMANSEVAWNELEYGPTANYIRVEFDFTNNKVKFYCGADKNSASLKSTFNFDGSIDFNAIYVIGAIVNPTYIDDIFITGLGEYIRVLTVSSNTLTIAAPANSTQTFDITSNTSWSSASNQSWLTLSSASGSNNATITLTAAANPTTAARSATVTVSGTGVSDQTITVTQEAGATGINNVINNHVSMFPNPLTNELTINEISINATISIFDLNGKLLITRIAKSTSEKIDVSSLAKGIYSIKVTDKKEIKTSKLIKQ